MKFGAVLWKEWVIFKRKFISTTLGSIVGPLLYLIAFGWGVGKSVTMEGVSYMAFVIPGIDVYKRQRVHRQRDAVTVRLWTI